MLIHKKFFAIILAVLMIVSGVGCSGDYSSAIIYYGVGEPPKNIDPQCATTITELILVRNLYEGLMRRNADGEIVNGVADSYTFENNTYTFTLREDAVWNDGTPVTADDFVFGIKRALLSNTNSPGAECLFSIKNAEKIYKKELPISSIGIYAINNKTLKIELSYDDKDFLYVLTTAAAMPCNEAFFNKAIGKYGMSLETVLTNGSYRMKKWSTEDFAMRIVKSNSYTGSFVPKNSAVYFSKNKEYTNIECLEKNYVDIAEIKTEDIKRAKLNNLNLSFVNNKVLILSINRAFTKNMRDALFWSAISKDDFTDTPSSFSFSSTLFPELFGNNQEHYSIYNPQAAKETYNSEIKSFPDSEFPTDSVYYYGDTNVQNIVKKVAANWQKNLGAYINITQVSNNSEARTASNIDYGIGIYTVEINEKNKHEYLENFDISTSEDGDIAAYVFSNGYSIPISFYGSCFANSAELSGFKIDSAGGILDFSVITKKK